MKKTIILSLIALLGFNTMKANERIYVNSDVTNHIVMPERIKMRVCQNGRAGFKQLG